METSILKGEKVEDVGSPITARMRKRALPHSVDKAVLWCSFL